MPFFFQHHFEFDVLIKKKRTDSRFRSLGAAFALAAAAREKRSYTRASDHGQRPTLNSIPRRDWGSERVKNNI